MSAHSGARSSLNGKCAPQSHLPPGPSPPGGEVRGEHEPEEMSQFPLSGGGRKGVDGPQPPTCKNLNDANEFYCRYHGFRLKLGYSTPLIHAAI
jgi:hypothetical protein